MQTNYITLPRSQLYELVGSKPVRDVAVDFGIPGASVAAPAGVLTLVVGLLMVSNIRYHSFKQVDFHGKVPFFAVVAVVLAAAVVLTDPAFILFLIFLLYAVSGPVQTLIALRRRRSQRAGTPQ